MTVANLVKQYRGAIPFDIARLTVAIDMYLTGDGKGTWEEALPPPPPAKLDNCQQTTTRRRLQSSQDSFESTENAGSQPLLNRPLLMSTTTGLARSIWSFTLSNNTFQRDRFLRATRYYYAISADWIIFESGITNHGLDDADRAAFVPRTKCDESCVSAADNKCTDGGFDSEVFFWLQVLTCSSYSSTFSFHVIVSCFHRATQPVLLGRIVRTVSSACFDSTSLGMKQQICNCMVRHFNGMRTGLLLTLVLRIRRWDSKGSVWVWFYYMDWVGGTAVSMMFLLALATSTLIVYTCSRGTLDVISISDEDKLSWQTISGLWQALQEMGDRPEEGDRDGAVEAQGPGAGCCQCLLLQSSRHQTCHACMVSMHVSRQSLSHIRCKIFGRSD